MLSDMYRTALMFAKQFLLFSSSYVVVQLQPEGDFCCVV